MRVLGGRPMTYLGQAFYDSISGKPVSYYRDTLGRCWLAEHRWALFRVPAQMKGQQASMSEHTKEPWAQHEDDPRAIEREILGGGND